MPGPPEVIGDFLEAQDEIVDRLLGNTRLGQRELRFSNKVNWNALVTGTTEVDVVVSGSVTANSG